MYLYCRENFQRSTQEQAKCEDCKKEYDQRMEFRKRLKEMRDQRLEQNPTETYFS